MECSIRVSVSEVEAPPASLAGSVFLKQLRSLVKRSWDSLRQSRLGLSGAAIVLVFALIALLAPWISPYPKAFEAPAADRFIVNSFNPKGWVSTKPGQLQPSLGHTVMERMQAITIFLVKVCWRWAAPLVLPVRRIIRRATTYRTPLG